MTKPEAEKECIRRWRELPRSQRATNDQANAFASALMEDIVFPTSADRLRIISGWLQRDLELRGRL